MGAGSASPGQAMAWLHRLNGAPENIVSLKGQRQLVANIGLAAGLAEVLAALGIDALDIADVLQHAGIGARCTC